MTYSQPPRKPRKKGVPAPASGSASTAPGVPRNTVRKQGGGDRNGVRGRRRGEAEVEPARDNMPPPSGPRPSGSQISQRQLEKKRALRRVRLIRLAKILAAVGVTGALIWLIAFSPVLALRDENIAVTVQSGQVDEEAVAAAGKQQVGQPLLRISTGGVERAILESPAIATAKVKRKWPHGLLIEVTQRKPVLAVKNGENFDLVGEDGVIIASQGAAPADLIVVEPASGTLSAGQLTQVLSTWSNLPAPIAERIGQISSVGTTLTFRLDSGAEVLWGDDSEEPLKAEVLELLLAQREATHYDVSNPLRPTTR